MATLRMDRWPLVHCFLCLECREIEYKPLGKTCDNCGLPMIPLHEHIDRDTARIRERIAKHGVQKATAGQVSSNRLHYEKNLTLYLTAPEMA